jgi:hypothetical protein
MSSLSIHFARALAKGRAAPEPRPSRESLLVSLLNKRATAQNIGADALESMLRAQILWSLPTLVLIKPLPSEVDIAA